MPLPVRFHDFVEGDLSAAVAYYRSTLDEVAARFVDRYEEVVDLIEMFPHAGRPYVDPFRRLRVRGFPYFVVYRTYDDYALVVALLDGRRDPELLSDVLRERG